MLAEILDRSPLATTLLYGPAGSGKTTLCLQMLAGRSIYISTRRNFNVERLRTMRADASEILRKLVLFEPGDLPAMEKAVEDAVKLSAVSDLLVVDSIAAYLRSPGTAGNLALHRILQRLSAAQCPVLITSEVYDRPGEKDVRFVGGDMLRLASTTIVELRDGKLIVKKDPEHRGREREYRITDSGLEKLK